MNHLKGLTNLNQSRYQSLTYILICHHSWLLLGLWLIELLKFLIILLKIYLNKCKILNENLFIIDFFNL
jgi:hypothetical protein